MDAPPAAAKKPCCVCGGPGGQHCTKCKSRHYCGKACQLVDWNERGHKAQCKQLVIKFQDRLLDELMQAKLKIKEEPPQKSNAEWLRRLQKHVDRGNAEAQFQLGDFYRLGGRGVEASSKYFRGGTQVVQLYNLAAAQGHARAQASLGQCYEEGGGVKVGHEAAAQWYRRAAEQGYPTAQFYLGVMFYGGKGVAQSYDEAVQWFRLAAAQGWADALFNLGLCHANGRGAPRDREALRLFKRAAAKGQAGAAAVVFKLEERIAANSGRPTESSIPTLSRNE